MSTGWQDRMDNQRLLRALMEDDLPAFMAVFEKAGVALNEFAVAQDIFGNTYLHLAALHAAPAIAACLVASGAVVDSRDVQQETPLHLAARNRSTGVVALLLANGADIEALDREGTTPLHYAVNHDDCLRLLLGAGAKTDVARIYDGRTPLHFAVMRNNAEALQRLATAGAFLDKGDYGGQTPLMEAAYGRGEAHLNAFKALLDCGASLTAVNGRGETALHVAASKGDAGKVALLLDRGANPNIADQRGRTPLMSAVEHSDLAMVVRLLESGANVLAEDQAGLGPLKIAFRKKAQAQSLRLPYGGDRAAVESISELLAETAEKTVKEQVQRQAQQSHQRNLELMDRILPPRPRR